MKKFLLSIGMAFTALFGAAPANAAVMYEYFSSPLTAIKGVDLSGASAHFWFVTPNYLPPNLTFQPPGLPPVYNVPIYRWGIEAGPLTAGSSIDPHWAWFLTLGTDNSGTINSWLFLFEGHNSSDTIDVSFATRSDGGMMTLAGPATDYVQITPLTSSYTDGAYSNTAGTWSSGVIVPDLPIEPIGIPQVTPPGDPSAVPEPATWIVLILGFGAVGAALRRRPAVRQPVYC